jgi:hypothetical protein
MIEIAPKSKNRLTYSEALLYCQFLEHGGYRDWRMPMYKELRVNYELIGWCFDRYMYRATNNVDTFHVTPVRDI